YGAYGQAIEPAVSRISWEQGSADLGGYPHYMIKEMNEQPVAMRAALDAYTQATGGRIAFRNDAVPIAVEDARRLRRLILVGCGSAYHAAAVGKAMIERLTRLPVEIDIASEFRYREPILEADDLCVFISQSGETADTLAAMRLAAGRTRTLGIVNAVGSTLARETGSVLYTHAGPEIAVATTKGYTTQVLALALLALYLAQARGTLAEAAVSETLAYLSQVPSQAESVVSNVRPIQRFASEHYDHRSVFYIGRGMDYAVAMEASLKLKEITYAHSEAYAAGELKHGTIALVEPGTLVVALVTQPSLADKMLSNIHEVKARGAEVLALTTKSLAPRVKPEADEVWEMPDAEAICMPLLSIIPMQLLAYYMALARGKDVDKPRNLAKSVTVE
ncbi:MAG: glutamine--fructose-6-phosphate transaminase (isomerizing), partial [Firmicutes bacterium]|nr:glutamine--fructose-6-phosphate transaminase (isomerizing) [Bacillota bacterium]